MKLEQIIEEIEYKIHTLDHDIKLLEKQKEKNQGSVFYMKQMHGHYENLIGQKYSLDWVLKKLKNIE